MEAACKDVLDQARKKDDDAREKARRASEDLQDAKNGKEKYKENVERKESEVRREEWNFGEAVKRQKDDILEAVKGKELR